MTVTECIEMRFKSLRRKIIAAWIEQFEIVWSVVRTEDGKEGKGGTVLSLGSDN